jgi:hypothetical protein
MAAHFHITICALVSGLCFGVPAFASEEPQSCLVRYRARSDVSEILPGTFSTTKDIACRVPRYVTGIPWQKVPNAIGPIRILERPKHGRVLIENRASFIYKPAPGYTGSDTMLIRFMRHRNQKGGFVRFDITVN